MKKVIGETWIISLNLLVFNIFMFQISLFSQSDRDEFITKDNAPKYLYGIASWYGEDFSGKTTASGAVYSPKELTAAHRSLPFGSRIEVENLSNGKKVEVIINDRGPFIQNRVLDLSKQAAGILGFLSDGTAFVKITILEVGSLVPKPVGLSTSSKYGQDIPDSFEVSDPLPTIAEPIQEISQNSTVDYQDQEKENLEYSTEELNNLLTEDDEVAFMNDSIQKSLFSQKSQAKAQNAQNMFLQDSISENPISEPKYDNDVDAFSNNFSNVDIQGFRENPNEFLLDDPLAGVDISVNDEFVALPMPPSDALSQKKIPNTPQETKIIQQASEYQSDPFAELFQETNPDPYSFQDEVALSVASPIDTVDSSANNLSEIPVICPSIPKVRQSNGTKKSDTDCSCVKRKISNDFVRTECCKSHNYYVIQVGAFSKYQNAMRLYDRLRSEGYNTYTSDVKIKGKNLIRVRVGYYYTIDEAINISKKIESCYGLENRIIKIDYDTTEKR